MQSTEYCGYCQTVQRLIKSHPKTINSKNTRYTSGSN